MSLTALLGLRHPIVQGPFGGGLSTPELAAAVSNRGGLGSYGAVHLRPEELAGVVESIRALTPAPFNVNLWVSTHDIGEDEVDAARFAAAAEQMRPYYDELGLELPARPERFAPSFDEQVAALLAARPPVMSVIYGVPDERVLDEARERGIKTLGTATTPEEAVALEQAGVDGVIASGFEAGGHRASFLRAPEESLTGTLALVPAVVDAVGVPVIAAGGIADRRGVAAALALGAAGVQIGTAFLATRQSAAADSHKAALRSPAPGPTTLTRAFTGRLARGLANRAARDFPVVLPFPYQGVLLGPLRAAAMQAGRNDLMSLWAGQGVELVHHDDAEALFDSLVE